MRTGNPVYYYSSLFPLRYHGSDSGRAERNGTLRSADGAVCDRNRGDQDPVDLCVISAAQIPVLPVYLLSGVMDRHDPHAGGMLLFCEKKMCESDEGISIRGMKKKNMTEAHGLLLSVPVDEVLGLQE